MSSDGGTGLSGSALDAAGGTKQLAARAASVKALRAALQDPTLDPQTKAELQNRLYQTGSLNGDLKAAKAGDGVFGDRRRNYQTALITADRPGLSQTFIAAGKPTVGDLSAAGMPSIVGGVDSAGLANLIRDSKERK